LQSVENVYIDQTTQQETNSTAGWFLFLQAFANSHLCVIFARVLTILTIIDLRDYLLKVNQLDYLDLQVTFTKNSKNKYGCQIFAADFKTVEKLT
jgi:hypothetical protein